MKKYIIIIVLLVTNIITLISLNKMSERASMHMKEANHIYIM